MIMCVMLPSTFVPTKFDIDGLFNFLIRDVRGIVMLPWQQMCNGKHFLKIRHNEQW